VQGDASLPGQQGSCGIVIDEKRIIRNLVLGEITLYEIALNEICTW
jgi:hypothetical protein